MTPAICHAGAGHPHDVRDCGPWGMLCSKCWTQLLAAEHAFGDAAREWNLGRNLGVWSSYELLFSMLDRHDALASVTETPPLATLGLRPAWPVLV